MKFKKKDILRALKRAGRRLSCHAIDRAHALVPSMTASHKLWSMFVLPKRLPGKNATWATANSDAPYVGRRDVPENNI